MSNLRSRFLRVCACIRTHIWLCVLGSALECIYLCYFLYKFPLNKYIFNLTDLGTLAQLTHASFLLFVLIFSGLFGLFILAWKASVSARVEVPAGLVMSFGLLFSSTSIFVYPIMAIDIYGWIAQSRVWVFYHANPMTVAPGSFYQDALGQSLTSFGRIPTPYGPLAMLIAALPALLAGYNLFISVVWLKLLCSLCVAGSSYLIYKIVQQSRPELAVPSMLLLAWNPYVQLEYVMNGHNDIFMLFFLLLAVFLLLKGKNTLTILALILGILIKYALLPLLPLFIIYILCHTAENKRKVSYLLRLSACIIAMLVIFFSPFWAGTKTFTNAINLAQMPLYSFNTFLSDLSLTNITNAQYKYIGDSIFLLCYIGCLVLATRNRAGLLLSLFICQFALLAFALVYIQPWYFIWMIIPALLIPNKRIRLLALYSTYMASIIELVHSYIWPWTIALGGGSFAILNSSAYLLLFGPPLFLLISQIRISGHVGWRAKNKDGNCPSREAVAIVSEMLIPSTSPRDQMSGGA